MQSGVAYGGAALLSGVNAITPHFSGAVDIMVVEQPDKTYRSTPFYGEMRAFMAALMCVGGRSSRCRYARML